MEYNVIIENENHLVSDEVLFFFDHDKILYMPATSDMWDVLVQCGFFSSRGQARKDAYWGKHQDLPKGWNEFEIGKKRHKLYLLNPI